MNTNNLRNTLLFININVRDKICTITIYGLLIYHPLTDLSTCKSLVSQNLMDLMEGPTFIKKDLVELI